MKLLVGSYISISYEIKYLDRGEENILISTKKRIRSESGEEKIIDEPQIVRLGEGELPDFFEKLLQEIDIEIERKYELDVSPEKAYGKRDPKKIESIPIKKLRRLLQQEKLMTDDHSNKIAPNKMLYINIGGAQIYYGRIIHVGDRDAIIDRNHPLAGKTLHVTFRIHKVVLPNAPKQEKIRIILEKFFGAVSNYITPRFTDENTLELELSKDYFEKFPSIDRENAETILREIYVPKILLLTRMSLLYKDIGITKLVWIDEYEEKIKASSEATVKIDKPAEASQQKE